MYRVERLEQLLAQAASRGLVIRQEWLGGRGGGLCEMRGQSYLFVDLALSVVEQLAQVSDALEHHSAALQAPASEAAQTTKGAWRCPAA